MNDKENAEKDIKFAIPFLFDSLTDERTISMFLHTGIIKEPDPEKQVIRLLTKITEKDFAFDAGIDEESKKQKVEEWKEWWEKEGKYQKLNLSGLGLKSK